MTIFGTELPERVEFLGVYFLINPATVLVAALVLGLAVAALLFGRRERAEQNAAYEKEFDFFGKVDLPTVENGGHVKDVGNLPMTQLKNGLVSIEDAVTEPIEVPIANKNSLAYQTYVNGSNQLPTAFDKK